MMLMVLKKVYLNNPYHTDMVSHLKKHIGFFIQIMDSDGHHVSKLGIREKDEPLAQKREKYYKLDL